MVMEPTNVNKRKVVGLVEAIFFYTCFREPPNLVAEIQSFPRGKAEPDAKQKLMEARQLLCEEERRIKKWGAQSQK